MERSEIKFLIIVFLVSFYSLKAQGLYVNSNHPVYNFLEKMEAAGLIEDYQNESKPILRSKVVDYLSKIFNRRFELNSTDRRFLNYFIDEFYIDIGGTLDRYEILFSDKSYNPFSNKEKFVYAYNDQSNLTLFVKAHLNFGIYSSRDEHPSKSIEGGGRFYGSLSRLIGFEFDAKNGVVIGNKKNALKIHELSYNFKLNENPESKFFDRSYGYLSFETPYFDFKLGRDRKLFGYGYNKLILSDYPPIFEAINFNMHYKNFSFEYLHSWLQKQSENPNYQNTQNDVDPLEQKYFAFHRIAFSPIKNLKFGVGESVIYLRTSPQLEYLNPLNFYKSMEHQLGDKDNALLFFDLEMLPIKNIRLYFTFVIDDIDFAKIGTGWYGNKTAFNIGMNLYNRVSNLPINFLLEYTRIEPYTFTHNFYERSYTNLGYSLSTDQPPNSYRFDLGINFEPDPKFDFVAVYSLTKWGKNFTDNNHFFNVGGELHLGKRVEDPDYISFLDGKIETINELKVSAFYELVRDIKISTMFNYKKFSSQTSYLILSIGLISFL
ncbi:MAG: hypothetical protein ACPL25_04510 [Ignavibacteria bacterium]